MPVSLNQCMNRFIEANAFGDKSWVCFKCNVGEEKREAFCEMNDTQLASVRKPISRKQEQAMTKVIRGVDPRKGPSPNQTTPKK